MYVTHEAPFTIEGTRYVLRKGYVHLGNDSYSKKPVYELSQTSSLHGNTREDIAALLEMKFEFKREVVEQILEILDRSGVGAEEEAPTSRGRVDSGAPKLAGGGLPSRPLPSRW